MAILPLVIAPDPRLNQPSKPVTTVDDSIRKLIADMLDTMYANNGIGLAAVQVGVMLKVVVVDVAVREGGREPMAFINPEIIRKSDEKTVFSEGCLSYPDNYSDVTRPSNVTIKYLDETGAEKTIEADEILATCLQHEIDHTNGVVFVDHISMMKRDMIIRKLKKAKRLGLLHELPEGVEL